VLNYKTKISLYGSLLGYKGHQRSVYKVSCFYRKMHITYACLLNYLVQTIRIGFINQFYCLIKILSLLLFFFPILAFMDIINNSNPFVLSAVSRRSCITFFLFDDNVIELTKRHIIRMSNRRSMVSFRRNFVTIVIWDDDRKYTICLYIACRTH